MAAKTWGAGSGAGTDGLWSTGANWTGDTVPATTDAITFDVTSVLNCNVDNVATFSGGTVTVATTYTGAITQNVTMVTAAFVMNGNSATAWTMAANLTTTTFAVTTGVITFGFTVSSGNFQCTTFSASSGFVDFSGVGTCRCTGNISMSSAAGTPSVSITCPPGTWRTDADWSQAGTDLIDFDANGGSVHFRGIGSETINVPSVTFNACVINKDAGSITISAGTTIPLGASPTVTTPALTNNGTITASGTWTHTAVAGGAATMTLGAGSTTSGSITKITITGDLTINATASLTASVPFDFLATTSRQDVSATAYTFGTCTINSTGNIEFRIAVNTTIPLGSNPTSDTGTTVITVNGTLTASNAWTHTGGLTVNSGGTVSGAITTMSLTESFTVAAGGAYSSNVTLTMTGTANAVLDAAPVTFTQVIFNRSTGAASTFTVGVGTTAPLGTTPTVNLGSGAVTWVGNFSATGTIAYTGGAVTFGASTVITGTFTWKQLTPVSFTLNAATTWPSTGGVWFDVTSANTRTLAGAGKTFASFQRTGSNAAEIIITGTNTFTTFTDNDGLVAHTLTFPNVTTTVGTFDVAGSVGKLVTLQRTGGAGTFTLTKSTAGAVNTVDYISVSNSTVDASPKWYAGSNSTDGTGNTNWIFGDEPAAKTRKQAILL